MVEKGQHRAALREIGNLNGTLVLTVCKQLPTLEIQREHEQLPALELLLQNFSSLAEWHSSCISHWKEVSHRISSAKCYNYCVHVATLAYCPVIS